MYTTASSYTAPNPRDFETAESHMDFTPRQQLVQTLQGFADHMQTCLRLVWSTDSTSQAKLAELAGKIRAVRAAASGLQDPEGTQPGHVSAAVHDVEEICSQVVGIGSDSRRWLDTILHDGELILQALVDSELENDPSKPMPDVLTAHTEAPARRSTARAK